MISCEAAREFQSKERRFKEQLRRCLSSALSADLSRLLQEEMEADVTLSTSAGSLRAHRAVLLARAPRLLKGQSRTDPSSILVPGYDLSGLKELIRRVYTAEQSMRSGNVLPNGAMSGPDVPHVSELQSSTDSERVLEPASGLGADLLSLYQRGLQCDITIQVSEQLFSCHRAVLCARSQYFRAMLSGSWMESSRQVITLQGLGPEEMEILLQFMYGAIVDLPSGASASQVVLAADMLGLDGLKDVVEMVLIRDYCRFFPKPSEGVQKGVLECLCLTHALGLHSLNLQCKRWIAEHFVKTWSERNFSLLSPELQRVCFSAVVETMSVQNAVTLLCGTEQLIGSLPEVKWAQQVRSLVTELQEENLKYIVQHFPKVIRTQAFQELRRREEFTTEPMLLRKLCASIREGVTVDNSCELFSAVHWLCGDAVDEDPSPLHTRPRPQEPFKQEICSLHDRLWTFLLQTFYAVRHTQGWESLSASHRERILADAIDTGDNRKLGKKPVFSSSQPRVVKCPSPAPESPSISRTQHKQVSSLAKASSQNSASAMKSDALGTAPKPGDGPKSKSVKKPGDRAVATKTKAGATPVVNGTSARRDVVSANGPRSAAGTKDQEKKPNPGARPKTSPPNLPSTQSPVSKVQKTRPEAPAAQATSTSGSASPENGASSPKNDAQTVPAAKAKQQVKTANKSTPTRAAQKAEPTKTSSTTNKASARESSKVKSAGVEKTASGAARGDAKGKGTAESHATRNGSSAKKPPSPKKDDKDELKAATEAPKKKPTTKPASSASVPSAKPTTKPSTKASSLNAKQPPSSTAKPGPKPKTAATDTASPKSGSKTTTTKKSTTKEKEAAVVKNQDASSDVATIRTVEPLAQDHKDMTSTDENKPVEESVEPELLQLDLKEEKNLEKGAVNDINVQAANPEPEVKSTNAEVPKPAIDTKTKAQSTFSNQSNDTSSPKEIDRPISSTPCSIGSTPLEDSWSGTHPQITPESETGSQATSSDDIKPRSEDYDAGGSQDDDFSNDRGGGVSKCGTMRCHDFLGRSSSDTSTPEELKMYESGLRVEVRMRGRDVETTSDEEVVRQDRPRSWLHRDEIQAEEEHSEVEATVTVKSVPEHQLFSSEDEEEEEEEETEDEKSEVEVIPNTEPSPHFQGIVNLAFDDETVEQENQEQYQTTSNFRRSVLLSVDECEELGEEAGTENPPQKPDTTTTPGDVFEQDTAIPEKEEEVMEVDKSDQLGIPSEHEAHENEEDKAVFLTELQEQEKNHSQVEQSPCPPQDPPQERPCHLDLSNAEHYSNGMSRKNPTETKKAELHLDLNEPQLTSRQGAQSPAGNV